MAEAVEFTLDGKAVTAAPGETIWQAAKRLGTDIPHLCYAPEPGYRADGNCRACMVEIEGERTLAASCIRTPTAGMKVATASPVFPVDASTIGCPGASSPRSRADSRMRCRPMRARCRLRRTIGL